jgi:predicted O-linked N-acetylglucosamine transferase (SPINDLY family)
MAGVKESAAREDLAQLYARALAQQGADEIPAAIETYRRCLSLKPDSPEIYNNLGTALDRAGRLEEAVECFQQALLLDPAYVRPLVNLGRVLRLQGRASEALATLERALALSPDGPLALTNLGFVLIDIGRRAEAIQHLRRAIALQPGLAEAHHGLGRVLAYLGDMAGARDSLQRAITLKPGLLDAHVLLASSLVGLQQIPDALAVLETYLKRRPDDQNALAAALDCSQSTCDWAGVRRALDCIRGLPADRAHAQPFTILGVSDDPGEHLQAARIRAGSIARPRVVLHGPLTGRHDRIRVAYVSGDFHTHATSFLIAELLELHDRSAFEVFGVSFGPDDQSPLRRRVLGAFAECLDARDRSDAGIASWLAEREVDIAVDLKGYTGYARPGIFAHRPAPLQVSYLGYPGTMAAPFIDYLIADPFVIPQAEQPFYTEKIAYLPDSYQVNDRRRRVAEHVPTRADAGLPESGFVFCCFNVSWKITASVFDVWMRLLAAVPGSVLWLLVGNRWAAQNLRREAAARNIAPERLIFCPRADNESHLARHRLADLFLDTFPCNAHTTASDALWAGLPLLTCSGRTFPSRVAGSLLRAAGLPELVASSPEEYERLALELARHPERLASLRARLSGDREALPLFDTPAFRRHLEAAYRHMWSLHREGRAPETFAVERITDGMNREPAALLRDALERHQAGDLERAILTYRRVLAERPRDPDALHMLGVALAQSGRPGEAVPLIRSAIETYPDRGMLHFNLGNAFAALRQQAEALAAYQRAADFAADRPEVHEAVCRTALELGLYAEAVVGAERTLALRPDDGYTLLNKISALLALNRPAEALECCDRAMRLIPDHWGPQLHRGVALAKLGRFAEAEPCLTRAVELNPQNPAAHADLGNLYGAQGRHELAVASFARALELQPGHTDARWNMGLLKLRRGELLQGWELYEERFTMDMCRHGHAMRFRERRWTGGESLRRKRIFIWSERGLGDTLQFCRYARLIRDLGADITLEVQARLKTLLTGQFPGVHLIGQGEPVPAFDYQCPLLSVPGALRTELATIPAAVPYLQADPAAIESWSRRLPARTGLRIGIVWQGNAEAERNWARGRSWSLAFLEPLTRLPDVSLISLQTGQGAGQLSSAGYAGRIVSFGEELDAGPDAFVDTAAIVMSLDLVISCDTSVAHLAGALGVPVWVALHATSEWRWLLDRDDSPWYPTMRLFRQRTAGDWGTVVDDMCRALADFSSLHARARRPEES